VVGAAHCGSGGGGVASGGTCYSATDCIPGYYCTGVTLTMAGTCTNSADKDQPPSDAAYPDGGDVPEDGIKGTDAPITPADTGGMKTPPVDSGGGGS
jgi:hypothetical protein